jgi:hypothetical protein
VVQGLAQHQTFARLQARRVVSHEVGDLVHQLHQRRDGRVEAQVAGEVVPHLAHALVRLAMQVAGGAIDLCRLHRPGALVLAGALRVFGDQTPGAVQELERTFHGAIVPLGIFFGRPDEQRVDALGVGAVLRDERVGRHHVALVLRHLGAVLGDHALGKQALERLVKGEKAAVVQYLGDEPRVQQVQDGVLHATDVLVHWHPSGSGTGLKRPVTSSGGYVAQKIP